MRITQRLIRMTVVLAGLGLLAGLAALVFISLRIGAEVRAVSDAAMQQHPGDRVEALLQCLENTNHGLRERNQAVWALGQLGDQRALPTLRKHHSGGQCDHATALCQRELAKAIRLLEGGVNVSAWLWRRSPHSRGGAAS